MRFRVEQGVLERFPGLTIGVVVVRGAENRLHREQVSTLLEEQTDRVRSEWSRELLESDPRIAAWRDAYRAFGAKPKKHRCSVENMLRAILGGGDVPSINPIVDLYNAISLEYVIPLGGDDLDCVTGDIRLTIATGDERFVPLNGSEAVRPRPGEVVYRDDTDVLCRRWNWRECDKSKLTESSTNVCLVVEGLPPFTAEQVLRIGEELAEEFTAHCGGRAKVHVLGRATPAVELAGGQGCIAET